MDDTHIHREATTENLAHFERLIKIKQLQINALLEISQAINNNLSTSVLLRIYEFTLRGQLQVKKLLVFIKNNNWDCVCFSGVSGDSRKLNVEKELSSYTKLTEISDVNTRHLKEFDVVIPVYHRDKPIAYVLIGELNAEYHDTYEEQLKFIQTITNIVIVAVENRKLITSQIEQQIMKKELEFAAKMQSMLFPDSLPNNEKIEMAAVYRPHHDIGGDYYDYIQLSDDEAAFCVGDISGKGVAAALLMANFQATLRMLMREHEELPKFMQVLNDTVSKITKGEKFITLFLCLYNFKTRRLKYINAGHNPALFCEGEKITELKEGCTLLGMFDDLPFVNVGEIKIKKKTELIIYTDGLIDVENTIREFYGLDRLFSFTRKNSGLSMEKFNTKLIKELNDYKGESGSLIDDITLLSCRFF